MLTGEEGADVPGEVEALKVHKGEWLVTKVQGYVREVAARHQHQPWLSSGWNEWTRPGLEPVGGDFLYNAHPEKNRWEVAPM